MTARPVRARRSILLRAALVVFAFAGATLASAHLEAGGALYTITDLGALGCCDSWYHASSALAVNTHGDVVGVTSSPTDPSMPIPFIYHNGTMTAITDNYGWATGINDAGQVTGFVLLPGQPNVHAFLYQDGVLTDLGGLPGYSNQPYAIGWAINNAGMIVGDSKAEAMVYENGTMSGLKRRSARSAYAVNDAGDVVGLLETMAPSDHAFLFNGQTLVDLGTLDGDPNSQTIAFGINARRQIVGSAWINGNSNQRAFLHENGAMTDIGTLAGGYAGANAINNLGQVIGYSDASQFVYRDGAMIDLNRAIDKDSGGIWPGIWGVSAINDLGQIAGTAYFGGSGAHACLLTPITSNP